jgi:hypothetical protein
MLITLETALLAKEKGFVMNSCTFYQYNANPLAQNRYELVGEDSEDEGFVSEDHKNRTAVCMQFVLQKWLREEHSILVLPRHYGGVNIETFSFNCNIHPYKGEYTLTPVYNTYEEALEKGLQEGLKLI